jgi:membrane-anchored protein YejM (alkaline phosphatase superfamily)
MTTASLSEIKKELHTLDQETVESLCNRLAKYKKENKELLTYLLFEAHDEHAYVENVKEELRELFKTIPASNLYLIKKTLRKILRFANKQIKYSGIKQTELELRIFFCTKVKEARIPLHTGTVLFNLYQMQLKKIEAVLGKLPEDLQTDYESEMKYILS